MCLAAREGPKDDATEGRSPVAARAARHARARRREPRRLRLAGLRDRHRGVRPARRGHPVRDPDVPGRRVARARPAPAHPPHEHVPPRRLRAPGHQHAGALGLRDPVEDALGARALPRALPRRGRRRRARADARGGGLGRRARADGRRVRRDRRRARGVRRPLPARARALASSRRASSSARGSCCRSCRWCSAATRASPSWRTSAGSWRASCSCGSSGAIGAGARGAPASSAARRDQTSEPCLPRGRSRPRCS